MWELIDPYADQSSAVCKSVRRLFMRSELLQFIEINFASLFN